MKSKFVLTIVIVIVVLLVVGISLLYSTSKETKSVKIGYLPILASLTLYVAQENGYFDEQEIKIETIQLQSSNQLVDALLRGDIDVVPESSVVPVLFVERLDSGKIKIFSASDVTPETPFDSLIVKKDSAINNLDDLENKKIGVFPGSTATNLLKKYLKDRKIDISKIEFIQIISPEQLPALYSGSIDVLHSYEPTTTIALESGEAKKLYGSIYAEQLTHNAQGVALISTKFITENPNLAKKAVTAFNKASDFIKQNDTKTRKIIPKYVKVDQNVADKVVFLYMSRSDEINKDATQAYADMLFELGELKTKLDVSGLFYSP